MKFRRPRRWSELSRVERVDLYTRQSLYLVLWGMCGSLLLSSAPAPGAGQGTAVIIGAVVVTMLGTAVMRAVIDNYPNIQPFPVRPTAALLVVSLLYLGLVGLPASGEAQGVVVVVVTANFAASLGGIPDRWASAAVILGCALVVGVAGTQWFSAVAGLIIGLVSVISVRMSLWLYGVVAELDALRHTQSRLAVAEERLRFSRDVHDVLGRHLSTIAVQAELAATLARRGDERAADQMMEVRQVAHDALTEARALARGYRPTSLGQELEGARALLRSAGIEVALEIGVVPRAWHEAAGWVVRESVTNVLRHSSAGSVRISFQDNDLRIENDGLGEPAAEAGLASGSGLQGLRERLTPLGAGLEAGRENDRWVVVAHLPGTGPLSAAGPAGTRNSPDQQPVLNPAPDPTRPVAG
ncbi:histidine kinase [Kineosporia rhizophila]|uniref:sensor histidine kinase n=1 Tax=Kineosporia rhizophila TaxID=84633 RepID=UPI001E345F29|nr:histidine kinase [Kineosporia rhizophila]